MPTKAEIARIASARAKELYLGKEDGYMVHGVSSAVERSWLFWTVPVVRLFTNASRSKCDELAEAARDALRCDVRIVRQSPPSPFRGHACWTLPK
jgi:hypothetical protein